jgi:hypothetical protein
LPPLRGTGLVTFGKFKVSLQKTSILFFFMVLNRHNDFAFQ